MKSIRPSPSSILFVISSLRNGGAEQCVVNAAEAAIKQGIDVKILVLSPIGLSRRSEQIQSITVVAAVERTLVLPIYLWRILRNLRGPTLIVSSFWPLAAVTCASFLFSRSCTIAFWEHSHTSKYSLLDLLIINLFFLRLDLVLGWERSYLPLLRLMPSLQSKALSLGNPIKPLALAHRYSQGSVFVVCVCSRLVKAKNIKLSLEAFALFAKNHDAQLRIFGDGPELQTLKRLSADLDIHELVYFGGVVDNITEELANSDITLITSLQEGFCNVVVESIYAGTPVLSVANGSIGDTILHDRQLGSVADPTPSSISDQLRYFYLHRPRITQVPSHLLSYESSNWVQNLISRASV